MKYLDQFRIAPGARVKLGDIDPRFEDAHTEHAAARAEIERHEKELRALQDRFYADGRSSLLICLQAMDTGGRYWDDYTAAYEDVLSRCSTQHATWFVIPSDRKWFRNLAVARIVVEYLKGLDLTYPEPTVDLAHIRREYHAAKKA